MTALLTTGAAVWAQLNGQATVTGFSIPEVGEDGEMKWKVLGDSARFNPSGGPVDITQVRMELYRNAKVDMVLTSSRCLFDREKREAETEAPVEISGKNIVITGDGFFWSGTNNLLVIRNNARVIVTNAKSFMNEPTNAPPKELPAGEPEK